MASRDTRNGPRGRNKKRLVIHAEQERSESGVELHIGGKVFIGLEPTIAQMTEIADLLPNLDVDGEATAESVKESLGSLYPQLAELLREQLMTEGDPHAPDPAATREPTGEFGEPPSQELLEGHVTVRQAARILNALTGEDDSGN